LLPETEKLDAEEAVPKEVEARAPNELVLREIAPKGAVTVKSWVAVASS
jgi:hypothetical protein